MCNMNRVNNCLKRIKTIKLHSKKQNRNQRKKYLQVVIKICGSIPQSPVPCDRETPRDRELVDYISTRPNYEQLALFLTQCFARENLDFITNVILYLQVVSSSMSPTCADEKAEELDLEQSESRSTNYWADDPLLPRLYALKLDFLCTLKKETGHKIKTHGVHAFVDEVYSRFICDTSAQCINISGDARNALTLSLQQLKREQAKEAKKRDSNSDTEMQRLYLHLFDGAVLEIYDCLNTLYATYFVQNSQQ